LHRYRAHLIASLDVCLTACALAVAFLARFDFWPPAEELPLLVRALYWAIPLKLAVFLLARLSHFSLRFVGMTDLLRVFWTNVAASVLFTAAVRISLGSRFPKSVYLIDFLICFLLTAGLRFAVRLCVESFSAMQSTAKGKGVLIYGAGAAGVMLLREIRSNPMLGYEVVGFLDDNPLKQGSVTMGVPVLGCGRDAAMIVDRFSNGRRRVDEILVAMPSASGRQMREALASCRAAEVQCKTLPSMEKLLAGQVLSSQIRNVSLEDLLGRDPVRLEEERIQQHLAAKCVLVTGAAGSIGSELCRQIGRFNPERLVLLDQAESELFRIDLELRELFPRLDIASEVGDIRDRHRIEEVLLGYAVDTVFHAAAYKHVPIMEHHVLEAVKNNVIGTWNVAQAAHRSGVSSFLMVSSDKAVNPTSVMGVTKRVAELIVSAASQRAGAGTTFVSVRFGNVLGSNGSVVPLFQRQIAAGGPITLTHPNVRRYFMSVQEAVQLVLQASTMGKRSEVFMLDMGEPIRILDLAYNMIRLAGLTPDEDIEVRIVGLRPGEKLYEELMTEGENVQPTYHEKIKIMRGPEASHAEIEHWMAQLDLHLAKRDPALVVSHLKRLVPEYQPDPMWRDQSQLEVVASL
jgi:FlaA1/EpsC-like NDP-sugar epimerase